MSVTRIATRYAKSLLELALQQGKLEEVSKDIAQLGRATHNKELSNMLKSPIIPADKKINVIDALFKDKVSPLTLKYMHLLTNKGRESYLPAIIAQFEAQYKVILQVTDVKVTLAAPASEEVMAQLKKKLLESGITTANLNFNIVIDPSIIGGYILEFQDKRYDASVVNKLAEYKVEFQKNLYIREF